MSGLNWHQPVHEQEGVYVSEEDLLKYSHVFRALAGLEKFDDERGSDDDGDEFRLAAPNPFYDAEIAAIEQRWNEEQAEKRQQQEHIKDLTQRVVARMTGKQWVAPREIPRQLPRMSSFSGQQQRFVVDMLARYWATGVPANPPPGEAQDVRKLLPLLQSMRAEQEEYIRFVREVNATQLYRYNFINPYLDRYVQQLMRGKLREAARTYPSSYQLVSMLPLAPAAGPPPPLYAVSAPLELGVVPICVVPHMRTYTDIKRQGSFLETMFPSGDVYPRERGKKPAPRDGTYLYKQPVSADPNVPLLSVQQQFDVVTSPSALKTLLDNSAPAWDRHWELPVTIRLVPGTQPGTHRKVVFVDKRLPARSMSNLERTARAHKRTVRILVCKRVTEVGPVDYRHWEEQRDRRKERELKNRIAKKNKNKGKKKTKSAEQLRKLKEKSKAKKRALKEMGEGSHQTGKRRRQDSSAVSCEGEEGAEDDSQTGESGEESDDGSSEEEGLQIDWPDQEAEEGKQQDREAEKGQENEEGGHPEEDEEREDRGGSGADTGSGAEPGGSPTDAPTTSTAAAAAATTTTTATSTSVTSAAVGSTSDSGGVPAGDCSRDATESSAATEAAEAAPGAGEPDAARDPAADPAAEAGKPEKPDPSEYLSPPPGLNVHYRVWQLGSLKLLLRATTHAMRENPNAGLVRYCVHARPAYQAGYGIEVMTRSEIISQWIDCLLRPNSRALRVHLDPISQLVVTVEERSLSQLTEEFAKYETGFRPQCGLQLLESVLRELTAQPPGQYLLSHDPRAGAFVRLSRASASGDGNLNLKFPETPRRVVLESPRSLSIDPSILMPYNTRYGRVPATFCYRLEAEMPECGWKEHWEKMKKQGVTRKKKNKKRKAAGQSEEGDDASVTSPGQGAAANKPAGVFATVLAFANRLAEPPTAADEEP